MPPLRTPPTQADPDTKTKGALLLQRTLLYVQMSFQRMSTAHPYMQASQTLQRNSAALR